MSDWKEIADKYLEQIIELEGDIERIKSDDPWWDIKKCHTDDLVVIIGGHWDCYGQGHGFEVTNPTLARKVRDGYFYVGDKTHVTNPTRFMHINQDIIGETK